MLRAAPNPGRDRSSSRCSGFPPPDVIAKLESEDVTLRTARCGWMKTTTTEPAA
jgi:hypothetical protein